MTTISQLIATLQAMQAEHGDLEVIIEYNGDESPCIEGPTPEVMSNEFDTVVVLNA